MVSTEGESCHKAKRVESLIKDLFITRLIPRLWGEDRASFIPHPYPKGCWCD